MTYAEALQMELKEQEADRGRMKVAGAALVAAAIVVGVIALVVGGVL